MINILEVSLNSSKISISFQNLFGHEFDDGGGKVIDLVECKFALDDGSYLFEWVAI